MIKIGFRVDGGAETGLGHIMRTLALAKAFPKNIERVFITKSKPKIKKLVLDSGFKVLDLNLEAKSEIEKVKSLIKTHNIDILITDSYELSQSYLFELKKVVGKLVSIHDFYPYPFPSDIVINGNAYAEELDYDNSDSSTDFLLGPKYTLMREEFKNISRNNITENVESILITVGGSDKLNLTPEIVKSFVEIKQNLHLDIVIGPGFNNLNQIINALGKVDLEISLHFNLNNMSGLMLSNDLAISAGGSTLYELATTGTPAITLLQADNQIRVAKSMEKKGVILNLGFGDRISQQDLRDNIKKIMNDFNLRREMSLAGQRLIDGQGAERVAKFILEQ